MDESPERKLRLVLDTNLFVAAGFNPGSSSAAILRKVSRGDWVMVWNHDTRREIVATVSRIPPLADMVLDPLFRAEGEYVGQTDRAAYAFVKDPDDRKFAALAVAADAVLVTNDDHLLTHRDRLGAETLTPSELLSRYDQAGR